MKIKYSLIAVLCLSGASVWAASDFAPAVPDLNLPSETEEQAAPAPAPKPVPAPARRKAAQTARPAAPANKGVIAITNSNVSNEEVMVQKMNPTLPPVSIEKVRAELDAEEKARKGGSDAQPIEAGAPVGEQAATVRDTSTQASPANTPLRVSYKPVTDRDPTLSPDDVLLLKHREEERLRAIELEKQRRLDAEKKRLTELERQRQLELERLRDPSKEIRGKIHINGIIGQEVFIGERVYTVGQSVLGAKIVSIQPDAVVFTYKGQKFTKKVTLK